MSGYIEVIRSAVLFFPILAFIFSIPFILHNYHKFGSISFLKSLIIYSFIFYLLSAYFLVILPLPTEDVVSKLTTPRTQFIPLKFIYDFIYEVNIDFSNLKSILKVLSHPCFYIPIYNIVLTIPFGIYIKYYFKTSLKKTILATFLLSLFFELTQLTGLYFLYSRGYRLFDIDDLILNTLGGALGYLISKPLLKIVPNTDDINEKATIKGMKIVSGFRKATAILLDIFLILLIWLVSYLIIKGSIKHLFLWVIFIYLFIIPSILKGRTLSEVFLNILVVNKKNKVNLLRTYIRRILFIFMYIAMPFIILYFYIHYLYQMTREIKILLAMLLAGFLFIFYILSIIKYLFIKKPMLYEKLSGTKYISTIKLVKEEEINEENNDSRR